MKKTLLSLFTFVYSLSFSATAFAYVEVAGDIPEKFLEALNTAREYRLIEDEYEHTTFDVESMVEKCSSNKDVGYAEVKYFLSEGQFSVKFYTKEIMGLTENKSGILVSKMTEKHKYRTTCKLKPEGINMLHGSAFYRLKPRIEKAYYQKVEEDGTLDRLKAEREADIEKAKTVWQKTELVDDALVGVILARNAPDSSDIKAWYLHYDKKTSEFYIAASRQIVKAHTQEQRKAMTETCAEQAFDKGTIEINGRPVVFSHFCQFRGDTVFIDLKPVTKKGKAYFINEFKNKKSVRLNNEIEISAIGFTKIYNELRSHYKK